MNQLFSRCLRTSLLATALPPPPPAPPRHHHIDVVAAWTQLTQLTQPPSTHRCFSTLALTVSRKKQPINRASHKRQQQAAQSVAHALPLSPIQQHEQSVAGRHTSATGSDATSVFSSFSSPSPRLSAKELSAPDDVSPSSILRSLSGLNALSQQLHTEMSISNQHRMTITSVDIKRLKKQQQSITHGYDSLLHSAFYQHKRLGLSTFSPHHPPSRTSAALSALEQVFFSTWKYSTPTTKQFTMMVDAYGSEAKRTQIRDLYETWREQEQQYLLERQLQQQHISDSLRTTSLLDSKEEFISPSIQRELDLAKEKHQKQMNDRRMRLLAAGAPASKSLYPNVRLDTIGYNALITAYTASLPLDQLKSDSPLVRFPLSLLPHFKFDLHTYPIVMSMYSKMGEVKQVLQLYADLQLKHRADSLAREGRRELQEVRRKKKEHRLYVYSILLHTLAHAKEEAAAETVWNEMKLLETQKRLLMNRVVYHGMLEVYAVANQHEKMRSISVEMRKREIPMNEDSICTVIRAMVKHGHIQDVIMLHSRLEHGSLGVARPHRKTYLCLLGQLATEKQVAFNTFVNIFSEGMDNGLLRSPAAHRHKWVIDLRALPLFLLPVSIEYHLQSMLSSYVSSIREKGRSVAKQLIPDRGLLILLGKNRSEKEMEGRKGRRDPSRTDDSLSSDDANEYGEEEDTEQRILVDPFMTEEEQQMIDKLDAMRVEGSYVQRYVKHLLEQRWPMLHASIYETKTELQKHQEKQERQQKQQQQVEDPFSFSSLSVLLDAESSALLRVPDYGVRFWLDTHAHLATEEKDPLFPKPKTQGSAGRWWEKLTTRVKERKEQMRKTDNETSIMGQLLEYKRREREQLQRKAAVLSGDKTINLQQRTEGTAHITPTRKTEYITQHIDTHRHKEAERTQKQKDKQPIHSPFAVPASLSSSPSGSPSSAPRDSVLLSGARSVFPSSVALNARGRKRHLRSAAVVAKASLLSKETADLLADNKILNTATKHRLETISRQIKDYTHIERPEANFERCKEKDRRLASTV